jgi:putative ABC transport system permease protein
MTALDTKLLRDLLRLRGQILAIALVVACGIASFVSMHSTYASLQLSQATYYEQYRFAQVFDTVKRAPNSLAAQIAALPGVAQVQTRVVADVPLDVPGRQEPATGRLVSIPERRLPMLNDLYIRRGRYIEPGRRDEVLVGEAFAKANHLDVGDTVGAVLNGRWQRLRIVGIALSPEYIYAIRGGGDIFPDNQLFGIFWMGREALGTAFDLDKAFNQLALSLSPGTNEAEVIFRLDRLLVRYGGLGAYDRKDQLSNRFVSEEILQLQGTATIVPSIFLGIAAFLLHILLSRLISTQREQIAILKAFGYDNLAIGWHYLKFGLVIVSLGAVLGTGLGLWFGRAVTHNYARFYDFPVLRYFASPLLVLGAITISSGAAMLGGFLAVRRAVLLPPAEAMRPEPPTQFRPTVIERLGLEQVLSPAGRMILRNLERKPIQALLSLLGIALGVAMLVVGNYFTDAVQYLVDVQYRTVQREDVTVVFNEPRPARVRYDLLHLPGVLAVEPFRSVPVRLRFGHHQYRLALTGLPAKRQLHQLIDRRLHPVALPPEGLLLTTKLAEILGVKPGDTVTVEVLEGDRPVRSVVVAGLVDELLGVSAYLDLGALNRLMREDGVISGAYLSVDEHDLDRLYTLLKRTPTVAGVSVRQAAIARFEKTIAGSLHIFTSVMVVFACVIAFGVIYNAARISLSERSRDLATLCVIGFSQAEVAVVLLGEQVILTLAAIPLGFVLGYGVATALSRLYNSELYRFPLVISQATYGFASAVTLVAALVSGAIIYRQLQDLDLVAVLKTRE